CASSSRILSPQRQRSEQKHHGKLDQHWITAGARRGRTTGAARQAPPLERTGPPPRRGGRFAVALPPLATAISGPAAPSFPVQVVGDTVVIAVPPALRGVRDPIAIRIGVVPIGVAVVIHVIATLLCVGNLLARTQTIAIVVGVEKVRHPIVVQVMSVA